MRVLENSWLFLCQGNVEGALVTHAPQSLRLTASIRQLEAARRIMANDPDVTLAEDVLRERLPGHPSEQTCLRVTSTLRRLGVLDDRGNPTVLGRAWADDTSFPGACAQMLLRAFPPEMSARFSALSSTAEVADWLQRTRDVGPCAARFSASIFRYIAKGAASAGHLDAERDCSEPCEAVVRFSLTEASVLDLLSRLAECGYGDAVRSVDVKSRARTWGSCDTPWLISG